MAFKNFSKFQIFGAIILAIIASFTVTGGAFSEEKLYPVENLGNFRPPLILPKQPTAAANPFVPDLPKIPKIEQPPLNVTELVRQFEARNLRVDVLANSPRIEKAEVESCKALLEKTLTAIPENLTDSLDELKLFFSKRNPRGLSNSHLIELRCASLEEAEIVSVFVHELGHIVDLGKLKGVSFAPSGFLDGKLKIPADDPSIAFYKLSWRDEAKQKYIAERKDFVSGYAMTDPFEDFAESFNFYVLHGADFRAITNESTVLAKKYDFMKKEVFSGLEFKSERNTENEKRVWDTTLVEFNLEQFFKQI
ncbi:hypothetical protein K9N08_03920 [Candidatus Gracilibacteria bacterium]|nr:hypothetical protein [Candidatus Gracilibacteria bacterium]MCF7856669.1 hypothetical protein [Candidatus Gracilibacteria bacterium]MCF7897000.1 hypothetical protein [Candidatus Gracilibacteria bacterium]